MRYLPLSSALVATVFAGSLAGRSALQKWLDEDAVYIITDAERQAIQRLNTDTERDQFIHAFWSRRNPDFAPAGSFQQEHYRRIAFANEHFASGIPGWRTDRGRVYIIFGQPDEIESAAPAKEVWRYRWIKDIGALALEFADPTRVGEYRLALDATRQEALLRPRTSGTLSLGERLIMASSALAQVRFPTVAVDGPIGNVKITVPISGSTPATVYGRITDTNNRVVLVFEEETRDPVFRKAIPLVVGLYHLMTVVQYSGGSRMDHEISFEVK